MINVIEQLKEAIGDPSNFWELRHGGRLLAAVGRWSHHGVRLDLTGSDATQFIFNVSGGQRVKLQSGSHRIDKIVSAGSVAINRRGETGQVSVTGEADTIQVVVADELIHRSVGQELRQPLPQSAVNSPELQAFGARALVALGLPAASGRVELNTAVRAIAAILSTPAAEPRRCFVGGLSAAARQRVEALIADRLRPDWCEPLSIAELADAADLSQFHFIQAFRQTAGATPYARLLSRRIELALSLLLLGETRVDMVGERTGFSSPAHFVSTFRQRVGVTPGAIREAALRRK